MVTTVNYRLSPTAHEHPHAAGVSFESLYLPIHPCRGYKSQEADGDGQQLDSPLVTQVLSRSLSSP